VRPFNKKGIEIFEIPKGKSQPNPYPKKIWELDNFNDSCSFQTERLHLRNYAKLSRLKNSLSKLATTGAFESRL